MVCNHEDATALSLFMGKIKERCGNIHTKVFMSDDAENFIFIVDGTRKLLCARHIDKRLQYHHHLHVLLAEGDAGLFQLRLQQFISWLLDSCSDKDKEMSKCWSISKRKCEKT